MAREQNSPTAATSLRNRLIEKGILTHHAFEKAQDLYSFVRSADAPWKDNSVFGDWVFRGVNDTAFENQPKAFRFGGLGLNWRRITCDEGLIEELHKSINFNSIPIKEFSQRIELVINQIDAELAYGRGFWVRANRARLVLANDEPPSYLNVRGALRRWTRTNENGHPFHEVDKALDDSTYALAQHYSVPTRRLDITLNPMIALFFAAYKANCRDDTSIGFYAYCIWDSPGDSCSSRDLPRYKHHFLDAQDALFESFPNAEITFLQTGRWPSLESEFLQGSSIKNSFYHLSLPAKEAKALLRLISLDGLTLSRVMPSFDTVATELIDDLERAPGPYRRTSPPYV